MSVFSYSNQHARPEPEMVWFGCMPVENGQNQPLFTVLALVLVGASTSCPETMMVENREPLHGNAVCTP